MNPRTLFEKIWDLHVIAQPPGSNESLLYVDWNLVHEGPFYAFDGLRQEGRAVRTPLQTLAFADHYVPTLTRAGGTAGIADPEVRTMIEQLEENVARTKIVHYGMQHEKQGIMHVVGPELGYAQPGMLFSGADSHTSTYGAFGTLGFGVGASQVKHILATQTLWYRKPRVMRVTVGGKLPSFVSAKDVVLAIIANIGIDGAVDHVIEYAGSVIRAMSMEGRMTICNMSIEAGARAGMIAPDETTFAYLEGRDHAPQGPDWDAALEYWRGLRTDEGASFDAEVDIYANDLTPFVTWGTNPGQGVPLGDVVPDPASFTDPVERTAAERALEYMDLKPGTPLREVRVDTVFVGSCTNGRIEDLRAAANVIKGRQVAESVRMLVVPGSVRVRLQAEAEGLDKVFLAAGAEWRQAGCSMCLGMNPDILAPGERSASTSNRNFEGRQGKGGRTHLVSPLVAAATAVTGQLSSPDDLPAGS